MPGKPLRRPSLHDNPFVVVCDRVASLLAARGDLVGDLSDAQTLGDALLRLRESMRRHLWSTGERTIDLGAAIADYDRRTRRDGFHALHDWDGVADRVNEDIIPVDVLDYLIDKRGREPVNAATVAILIDYYAMHLLALLSLRIWDDGDADANLDGVESLLQVLQSEQGSGQLFAADAETLLLIATSHYERAEWGYDKLLVRARTLSRPHQLRIALGHASSMGNHLRFGFEATYGRDTVNMRNDNTADYPWLCYALATVMREYVRLRSEGTPAEDRAAVVEAMLNGLSADARAFVGAPPASLSASEAERLAFREAFHDYKTDLLAEFEAFRPAEEMYSPISFFFNFSHNVVKGAVIDALLEGDPWPLTLNDVLTALPREPEAAQAKEALAKTLMIYARANPHRIRGQLMPVIVYDPAAGRQAFSVTMRKLKE